MRDPILRGPQRGTRPSAVFNVRVGKLQLAVSLRVRYFSISPAMVNQVMHQQGVRSVVRRLASQLWPFAMVNFMPQHDTDHVQVPLLYMPGGTHVWLWSCNADAEQAWGTCSHQEHNTQVSHTLRC